MSYIALSHHQICSLTAWHTLSLSSSLYINSSRTLLSCLRNLSQQWSWQRHVQYIVSSSVMRVVFDGRLFLAAFRYFSKNLFRASMVFGEELNLHQGHGACFRPTIYHFITCMIYLMRAWVLAAQNMCAWACILSRSAASLFILSSGESLCWLVVVHDMFVNCCIAML